MAIHFPFVVISFNVPTDSIIRGALIRTKGCRRFEQSCPRHEADPSVLSSRLRSYYYYLESKLWKRPYSGEMQGRRPSI